MIIISQHQQHMFVDHVRLINDEFQFKAKLSRYREGRLQSIDVESSIIILQPDAEMACTFLLFCCRTSLKYFVGKSIFSQCPQQTYRKKAKNSKEKKIWLKKKIYCYVAAKLLTMHVSRMGLYAQAAQQLHTTKIQNQFACLASCE